MYELLKNICLTNLWDFVYARRDFANLYNETETNKPILFLDPVQITKNYGEYNQVESTTYNGHFMLLFSSDIDNGDYDFRYQTYIKPILTENMGTINNALGCLDITIESWRETEVINVLDYNFDGILVNYQIKSNV